MFSKIKSKIKSEIKKVEDRVDENKALNITHHPFIEKIVTKPDFPWFISFPRTGSHWIRMVMELYFEKPSLVEIYYYKDAKEFTCYHRHDIHLTIGGCTNVLYLYRSPVETVFSYLMYHKLDLSHEEVVKAVGLYCADLKKWLLDENFSKKKTVIYYDNFLNDFKREFKKVTDHFNIEFNSKKLDDVLIKVSKDRLKSKVAHDKSVVNPSLEYKKSKEDFIKNFNQTVMHFVEKYDERLVHFF